VSQARNDAIDPQVTSGWLFGLDDYLDCGVQPENLAVTSMMLRVPVPDTPFDFAEKVEATLLRQVPEVADQICDGVLVPGAAVLLKNCNGLGSPCNVIGFIRHA
jgi:hypothetical protein